MLVRLIASFCLAKGLWDLGDFLSPFFSFPAPITIKVFPLVVGVWEVYAGFHLFKLKEAGRKLTVTLSLFSMGILAIFIFWTLFFWEAGNVSAVYYRDTLIFQSENRFIFAGMQFVFVGILLLVNLFLSQAETKKLFAGEGVDNVASQTFVESA
jgi:hypothetical protein